MVVSIVGTLDRVLVGLGIMGSLTVTEKYPGYISRTALLTLEHINTVQLIRSVPTVVI